MLVRLPKSAISVCPIALVCLISYANYTIYSFRFIVWLPKNAQGKRSLLIQECIAQLPHPCEASDKLIPQISPRRRKYLPLLHHIHMNRCSQPTALLLASLKSRMKPTLARKSSSQSSRTMSRWNMSGFVWEHSLSYPGLAALTHENFASAGAQDFSNCLTLRSLLKLSVVDVFHSEGQSTSGRAGLGSLPGYLPQSHRILRRWNACNTNTGRCSPIHSVPKTSSTGDSTTPLVCPSTTAALQAKILPYLPLLPVFKQHIHRLPKCWLILKRFLWGSREVWLAF